MAGFLIGVRKGHLSEHAVQVGQLASQVAIQFCSILSTTVEVLFRTYHTDFPRRSVSQAYVNSEGGFTP